MKNLFLYSFATICLAACSEEKNGTKVEGADMTGSWRLTHVECHDRASWALTAMGTVSKDGATSTIYISRNTVVFESKNPNNACSSMSVHTFKAELQDGNMVQGYGMATLGESKNRVKVDSTCVHTHMFTMTQGTLSPSTFSSTSVHDEDIPSSEFDFIIQGRLMGLGTTLKVENQPNDICLLVYDRRR